MLLWLKEISHPSQRMMQGMLSGGGCCPVVLQLQHPWNWSNGRLLQPCCQRCEQQRYLSLGIDQHNARAERQHVIPSGCSRNHRPSLFGHQSASKSTALKAGWGKGQEYLQPQEREVSIPSTASASPCSEAALPGARWQWHLVSGARTEPSQQGCPVFSLVFQMVSHLSPAVPLPTPPCHHLFAAHFLLDIGCVAAVSIAHGKDLNLSSVALITCWECLAQRCTSPAEVTRKRVSLFRNHLGDDISSHLLGYRNYEQLSILCWSLPAILLLFLCI